MTNRRSSVARFLVAVMTMTVLVAPLAAGAAGAEGARQSPGDRREDVDPSLYWETVQGPRWGSGRDAITQYAWDPNNTSVLYVTNGTELQVSGNQGDSWRPRKALPTLTDAAGFSADDSTIVDLEVDESTSALDAYALVEQTIQGVKRPHVVASHDGGKTWAPSDLGLPPTGRPILLRVAPNDPNEVYLAIAQGDDTIDALYKSSDSGATWTLQSDLSRSRAQDVMTGLEIDPQDSDELWATATTGLYHSIDGGVSFTKVDYFSRDTGPVDVYNGAGPAHVSVFVPGLGDWFRSNATGGWGEATLRGVGAAVESVAHGDTKDTLVIAAGGNAFAWDGQTLSWVDLEQPAPGIQGIVASRGLIKSFSGHTSGTIQIYTGPVGDFYERLPDFLIDIAQNIGDGAPIVQFPPKLGPAKRRIVMKPGQSKTVSYHLKLPPRPLPLDVYFLLDTSASTTTFLQNVARSVARIANGLAEKNIAVRFGLGDYRAYPARTPPKRPCEDGERASTNDCEPNYAYKQRLDLCDGCGDELATALETLTPDGGGEYRSMYAALYQSVTGAGQNLGTPVTGGFDHDIPPGQQATFNADATKVILHAVDESFPTNETVSEPGPGDLNSLQRPDMTGDGEAIAALQQYGVIQVGLSTGAASLPDLKKVARETGALAPAGGVDCDGNGTIELAEGEPLVCNFDPNQRVEDTGLDTGIQRLLEATVDTNDVALKTSGPPVIIDKVSPAVHTNIVLQTTKRLEFDVTFKCPRLSATRAYEVDLEVPLERRADPHASATVVCRPPDPAEPEEPELPLPPAPPAAAALVALAFPPPPPPPPPILEISSASQSQTQAQAQAGMVHQEEQQPQLAHVTASHDIEEELAFARYEDEAESLITPIRALGAGAVVMSFAFGFLMLSQEMAREKVLNRRR